MTLSVPEALDEVNLDKPSWVCHSSGMARMTVQRLAREIKTEADAYAYMESLRWPDGPVCPHCGSLERHYFLKPTAGKARATRTGNPTERRVWKCKTCRKQFSVLTGTIFHGTKVELRTWLFVVFEMCANKNGIAAREIERKYGVAPKTAWFMTHRLREAMKNRAPERLLSGTVVADETWIGPEPRFQHGYKRMAGHQGQMRPDKYPVMALIEVESGEVRARVIPRVTGENLRRVLQENVAMPHTVLHTDMENAYRAVSHRFAAHHTVNHKAREYVRGDVTTNQAENFFSQLKRSLDGTHHHVSREHLDRYLAEFTFRHSTRDLSDTDRMTRLMGRTGNRRLLYKTVFDD
jgi:transposase-like protein